MCLGPTTGTTYQIDGNLAVEMVEVPKEALGLALSYIGDDDNGWCSRTTPEWFVELAAAHCGVILPVRCLSCDKDWADQRSCSVPPDPPSTECPGCQAYREHQE